MTLPRRTPNPYAEAAERYSFWELGYQNVVDDRQPPGGFERDGHREAYREGHDAAVADGFETEHEAP